MTISVENIETMSEELKMLLLQTLVKNSFLWWFKNTMQSLNIPQRTNHYKCFAWSSYYHRLGGGSWEDRHIRQIETCAAILNNSTISEWIDAFLKVSTLKSLTSILRNITSNDNLEVRVTVV